MTCLPRSSTARLSAPAMACSTDRRRAAPFGPFDRGLDVCCGTGAGMRVLGSLCREPVTGADFSAGMLAQARSAHPDAGRVRAMSARCPLPGSSAWRLASGRSGTSCPRATPAISRGAPRAAPWRAFASGLRRRGPSPQAGTGALLGIDLAILPPPLFPPPPPPRMIRSQAAAQGHLRCRCAGNATSLALRASRQPVRVTSGLRMVRCPGK